MKQTRHSDVHPITWIPSPQMISNPKAIQPHSDTYLEHRLWSSNALRPHFQDVPKPKVHLQAAQQLQVPPLANPAKNQDEMNLTNCNVGRGNTVTSPYSSQMYEGNKSDFWEIKSGEQHHVQCLRGQMRKCLRLFGQMELWMQMLEIFHHCQAKQKDQQVENLSSEWGDFVVETEQNPTSKKEKQLYIYNLLPANSSGRDVPRSNHREYQPHKLAAVNATIGQVLVEGPLKAMCRWELIRKSQAYQLFIFRYRSRGMMKRRRILNPETHQYQSQLVN
ncbi:NAD(P)-binding Rossmann-fold superfamily protein [Striga asiatica]|uniref:NAD(P)-binding Rossmann-fold superfamily protein n=1 Tax=Striga asiatica TaxID=4170 RepID=A0A5A7PF75_STRAF|nr:NAD(P)-binding Rossmann-fold superfamily protein [Striga asiatica]